MEIVAYVFQVMGTVACVFLETGTSVCQLAICVDQVICGVQEMVISWVDELGTDDDREMVTYVAPKVEIFSEYEISP
jgi:hypothetical protein